MHTTSNPASSAHVDLVVANNASFRDALQFDPPVPGVTGPAWTFTGQKFRMDVKPNHEEAALVSWTSDAAQIVVDDETQRVLHFNVPDTLIQASLIPGDYIYDLIMYDAVTPTIRVQIAHGYFTVTDGVTGD
jgi:hypothetical protein